MKQQDKEAMAKWIEGRTTVAEQPKDFYVYVAAYAGVVYYIGKGYKTRYKHVNSGQSGNKDLNRLHFLGVKFDIYIAHEGLTEPEAFMKESMLISELHPLYNKSGNPCIGWSGKKLKGLMTRYCQVCGDLFDKDNVPKWHEEQVRWSLMCVHCDDDYGHRD